MGHLNSHPSVDLRNSVGEMDRKTVNYVAFLEGEDPRVEFFITYEVQGGPTCVSPAALRAGRDDELVRGSARAGGGGHLGEEMFISEYCGDTGETLVVHGVVPGLEPHELEYSTEIFYVDLRPETLDGESGSRLRPQITNVEAVEGGRGLEIHGMVTAPARSQRVKVTIYPKNDAGLVYDALETIVADNAVLEPGQPYPFVIEGAGCEFQDYETGVEWVPAD